MTKHHSSTRKLSFVLFLLSAAPAFAALEAPAASRRMPAAVPSPLSQEVGRQLATAPADGETLAGIYARTVRSDDDAASFFQSAAFLRLGLGGQRQVIEAALALDPAGFCGRSEFLPMALRAEYRAKARQLTGNLDLGLVAEMSSLD
jgi:hypothetical protein